MCVLLFINDSKCNFTQLWFILQMLKMAGEETVVPPVVSLNLPADYEVQVAAHLTLQQLQTFGRDVDHYLKSLDKTVDEETDDR